MLCKLGQCSNDEINLLCDFHSHLSYVCTAWAQNLNSKHHKLTTEKSYADN